MASKTTNYNLDMPGYNEVADIDVINGNMDKIDVQMKKNADSAQQSKDIVSDEYSATNTYAVGDYCIHENILYKCKTEITTGEAFDSNKWVQTTCGTEFRELNSNLSQLEYSDVAGGKNLWSIGDITVNGGDKKVIFDASFEENTQYTFSFTTKYFSTRDMGNFRLLYTDGTYTNVPFEKTVGCTAKITSLSGKTLDYIDWYGWSFGETASFEKIQLEEGTVATPYEPYIPSVKMLAEEVNQQKNDLGGLSFSVSGTTLSITDGTNTWTLEAN